MVAPGDLYFAPFPYTDLTETKRRAVCISSEEYNARELDVIVVMITSRALRSLRPWDFPIRHPVGSLRPGSIVRAGRIAVLERSLLQRRIGALPAPDRDALAGAIAAAIDLG